MTVTNNKPQYPAHSELRAKVDDILSAMKYGASVEIFYSAKQLNQLDVEFDQLTAKLDAATRALEEIAPKYSLPTTDETDELKLMVCQKIAEQALSLINGGRNESNT